MSCISLQLGSQLQNRYNTPILISTTGAAKGKKDKDRCATDTGESALCIVERLAPLLPTTNANAVMCFRLEYNLFILLIISYRTSNRTRALFPKKVELVTESARNFEDRKKDAQPAMSQTEVRVLDVAWRW